MFCLLLNLDTKVTSQLQSALAALGCSSGTKPAPADKVDIVFSSAAAPSWKSLLRGASEREVPVVAVGSEPTEEAWVGALESGASDYLCTGFELAELRWILRNQCGVGVAA